MQESIDQDTADKDQSLLLSVFPNPSAGHFTLSFSNDVDRAEVSVIDNLGRQVYRSFASGTRVPLDISSLADGVYYIVVRSGTYRFYKPVVKG